MDGLLAILKQSKQSEQVWRDPASSMDEVGLPHVKKSGFQIPEILACGIRNPGF